MRISDWSSDVCSSDLLSRASGAGSTVPTGASTAAAPCAMACGMKSRPSARLPGSAAKRQPADTLRLSAVRPLISTSDKAAPGCMLCSSPFNSSVRRKLASFRSHLDIGDHLLDHRLAVVARRHAQQRADALDQAADQRRRDPAAGGVAVGLLGRLRLVDHGEEHVARIVHGKGADEGGDAGVARWAAPGAIVGRCGLAPDTVALGSLLSGGGLGLPRRSRTGKECSWVI